MASEFPKWRDELPTEPGWYWFQRVPHGEAEVVRVGGVSRWDGGMMIRFGGDDVDQVLSHYAGTGCRWSGPLTPPTNKE